MRCRTSRSRNVASVAVQASVVSVGRGMLTGEMTRHTTFRYCLDPTIEQHEVLAQHAGASRFAFNQCLRMVKTALTHHKAEPDTQVPWTGFDLINAFNVWKKTEDAGRVFVVDSAGVAELVVITLWEGGEDPAAPKRFTDALRRDDHRVS